MLRAGSSFLPSLALTPIFFTKAIIRGSLYNVYELYKNIPLKVIGTLKAALNWPMSITAMSVIASFGVCFVTGVFFGWYPARKPSRLDPIKALRFE